LFHRARIERVSGYLKQTGGLSRQSRGGVAVGSDIPVVSHLPEPRPRTVAREREPEPGSQASTGIVPSH
jgi:hypothetical protein